jgi:PAS domain S-box-containing protein
MAQNLKHIKYCVLFALVALFTAHSKVASASDTLEFYIDKITPREAKRKIDSIMLSGNYAEIAALYNRTAIHFSNSNQPQRSIGYFSRAIELYDSLYLVQEKAVSYGYLASVYYEIARYERSIESFRTAYALYLTISDSISAANQLIDIAFVYSNTFRSRRAVQSFKDAEKIYAALADSSNLAKVYYYLGKEFDENSQLDSAAAYYKNSLDIDEAIGAPRDIAASYNNLGVVHYMLRDYRKSMEYLSKLHRLAAELKSALLLGTYFKNVANIHFDLGNLRRADSVYRISLKYKKMSSDRNGEAATLFNIANVFRAEGNIDSAISNYNTSLELSARLQNSKYQAYNYKALSEIYKIAGDQAAAFDYYRRYVSSMYSIYADEEQRQLTESQTRGESSRRVAASLEREIRMQQLLADYNEAIKKKEIENAMEQQKLRRNWNLFLLFVVVLFILAALAVVWRNMQKKKANAELDSRNSSIEASNATIQKQADQLKESNMELEKLSIVASKTDTAVVIMDENGNYEWVNEAYSRIFGFSLNELLASNKNIAGGAPDFVSKKLADCKTKQQTVSYDQKTQTKSGAIIWVSVTLTPILGKDGNISKLVAIDSDITGIKNAETEILQQKEEIETQRDELLDQRDYILSQKEEIEEQKNELALSLEKLKSAQKKLVESEKMAALGNLVAGVAHEINTPIGIGLAASTSMYNKTLKIEELFSTKQMKMSDLNAYIDTANQACELMLSNLNRTAELVKSFKQVSIDNMTEQKREFMLDTYIDDVVRSLGPKLKHRPITVNLDFPKDLKLVSYPGAFAQIFTNFIINSLIHAYGEEDKGRISISAIRAGDNLKIVYQDDGKGIPEQNLAKVFDPFFTTNMQVGTGLGMNITYNIVNQKLGGDISLESSPGNGVKFSIVIPFSQLS